MRTTVNIDDHLLGLAKTAAARTHRPLGAVIEDGLRVLLSPRRGEPEAPKAPELPVDGGSGFVAGVDLENKDQLADILGDNSC